MIILYKGLEQLQYLNRKCWAIWGYLLLLTVIPVTSQRVCSNVFRHYIYTYIHKNIYIYPTERTALLEQDHGRNADLGLLNTAEIYFSAASNTSVPMLSHRGSSAESYFIPITRMILSRTQRWQWDIFHLLFP